MTGSSTSRRGGSPHRLRWVRVVLVLLLGVAAVAAVPPPARADDPQPVTIRLTSVSPSFLDGGSAAEGPTVTITGTVTNDSTVPMRQVQVSLWRSFDPITDHTALAGVLDAPASVPLGARTTDPDGNLFNITSEEQPEFAPGATAQFRVQARSDQLRLPDSEGAYLVGVHVRAIPRGEPNQLVGRSRVLLPAGPPTRGSVSPVVVLSSRPAMVGQGIFTDDHLAGELRGRLGVLLEAAEDPASLVLVDPSLVDELTAMSQGYSLVAGDPDPDGQARATAWLARLGVVLERPGVYRLPYGNANLLVGGRPAVDDVVAWADGALPEDHRLAPLGLALLPRTGVLDEALLARAAPLKPVLVVTQQGAAPPAGSTAGVTVLNADPGLRAGGPTPAPSTTTPQVLGRLLSELALSPRPSAVLLVRETSDVQLLRALPAQVTVRPALELPSQPVGPSEPAVVEGDPSLVTEVERARQRILAWGDLTGTVDAATLTADQVAARAASAAFGDDSARAKALVGQAVLVSGSDVSRADVRMTSAESFVMSGESTSFPVTVTNREATPVRVKVRFTSENPQRVSIPDSEVVTVPAGGSVTVTFSPQARTNGVVSVRAQVVTPEGAPVGPSRRVQVTATNFGDLGWIIIIASGVVLLGTTALRIRQVQRVKAAQREQQLAARTVRSVTEDAEELTAAVDRQRLDTGRPHP